METGRELFSRFLRGEPLPRPAYAPLLRGLTARVGGVASRELTGDPTLWANSLGKTAELFDLDGVVAGFHFSLLAEACGCELAWEDDRPRVKAAPPELLAAPLERGRLPGALEATRRVFELCRAERGVVAALAGPLTLAAQVAPGRDPDQALAGLKPALVEVYERFCQLRPDALLLMESGPLAAQGVTPARKRLYFTLKKIAAYYDVAAALYVQDHRPEQLEELAALKMDVYILGPDQAGRPPAPEHYWRLAEDCLGVGLGLDLDDPAAAARTLALGAEVWGRQPRKNFFFTSLGPARRSHDPQTQLELVRQIKQMRR